MSGAGWRRFDTVSLRGRERYDLLTSLVVPRPIGWISTWSPGGTVNLAPFSYFSAVAASPMLVSVSIGERAAERKDTARNILEREAFCVNVVTADRLEAMVATSAEVGPGVSELELAGLEAETAGSVDAPCLTDCPAVLECRLFRHVDLGEVPTTLIVGEVVGIRVAAALPMEPSSLRVRAEALRPVGRLGGDGYAPVQEVVRLRRPRP